MTRGMVVRVPVTVAFGTDEEFDLRAKLERELAAALRGTGTGESAGGEIDTSHMRLYLDGVEDPVQTREVVKDVLARAGLLHRAEVILETRCELDPDDCDWQILWSPQLAEASHSA